MDAKSKTLDSIINMYKSQLRKFERLSVRDDDGNFLFGKNTEFGTTVTEALIENTHKRLMQLMNQKLHGSGIKPIANYTNGKAKS
tara:strand:- start:104 stop:358 length:255 start_codon:yes stop_codon:yes gene_type:complete